MDLKSSLFDSLRTAKKKPVDDKPKVMNCQWDGCELPGTHKAPVGRMKEGEFFHFCVDHVRAYNKSFNYFSGLSDGEVARFQREAMTGDRPTWKAGVNAAAKADIDPAKAARWGRAAPRTRTRDASDSANRYTPQVKKAKPLEAKALDTLGLTANATKDMVKARYKELVKQHHPDANGGNRDSEDRFRDVIQAYQLLKTAGYG